MSTQSEHAEPIPFSNSEESTDDQSEVDEVLSEVGDIVYHKTFTFNGNIENLVIHQN